MLYGNSNVSAKVAVCSGLFFKEINKLWKKRGKSTFALFFERGFSRSLVLKQ